MKSLKNIILLLQYLYSYLKGAKTDLQKKKLKYETYQKKKKKKKKLKYETYQKKNNFYLCKNVGNTIIL